MTIGDLFHCHRSTVCRKIPHVLRQIAALGNKGIIDFPSDTEEIRLVKNKLYDVAQFPGVIGCIDCTHVKIQSVGGDYSELDRNRKGYFSINVQCVCDANLRIQDIVARWGGSTHDQTIFDNSFLKVFSKRCVVNCVLMFFVIGSNGAPRFWT
jgi:nuclease HARBI1